MAKKRRKKRSPEAEAAGDPARRSGYMAYVLVGLAVAVGGLTVYVGLGRNEGPSGPGSTQAPKGLSEEQKVLQQARGLMQAGAYRQAAELMATYVRHYPRDIVVRLPLAEALRQSGQAEAAERIVDEHLQLTKPTAAALWMKGELVRRREFQQFSVGLTAAVWLPGAPMPGAGESKYMHYFRLAAEEGVGADANTWMSYAMELLRAEDRHLRGHGDLLARREELAETYLTKALAAGKRDVDVLKHLGDLAFRKDDFERAALMLSEAVKVKSDSFPLWLMLARAQKQAGQQDQAAVSADRALAIHRGKDALYLKGQIEFLRRDYAAAAGAFAEAATDPRLRGEASVQAAQCYYQLRKYALAMKFIDIASTLRPADPSVARLRKYIEDERFGPVATEGTKPTFRLRPTPEELDGEKDPKDKAPAGLGRMDGLGPATPAGGKTPGSSVP